ncbi:MAG: purine-nucleoside phosphorylase [Anaerolineae bacterium]|nr:purine-nucleoside phosphorylase [Anaerolineae bacterium]
MEKFLSLEQIDEAANFIRSRITASPQIGMILGSGLGSLADLIEAPQFIEFAEIPFCPVSTVEGHKGRLVIGKLEGKQVMVLQGRIHYYEGYSMDQVTFPVRVMQRLGVEYLIVTNAAGAIHPSYMPGDVMLITDHISLMTMTGANPLRGPNLREVGERFPDMSQAYDRPLMALAREVAAQEGVSLCEGVYIGLAGPSYETPADLRFLRVIGADAVGMSTVPEVIVARHGGMRVLGFSGISNKANLDGNTITTHEEVLKAGEIIVPKLQKIILGVLRKLSV